MAYQMHKISVLVVEDNLPMLEITKALLMTFGIGEVFTAHNGEGGFQRYCATKPDIVIADWMMKPMDGISFTRKIRNDPASPNPFVPVILMTGFSERRRVLQARDAGVTEFLVKPFNARDLYKRITQIIERPRQFVRSDDFFGPDRRRQNATDSYQGPRRRENDLDEQSLINKVEGQKTAAQQVLRDIRTQSGLKKGDKFDPRHISYDWITRKD